MTKAAVRIIDFESLRRFCAQAYRAVGVPAEEADIAADLLARSDLRGVASHGVMRLAIYIKRLEMDYVRPKLNFKVIREKGATAYVDGRGSMGHLTARRAMTLAAEKAEEHGIGWVTVKDSGHFGIAGLFPLIAARRDLIGALCSNSAPMMAPFGGKQRIIGNNPLSYAFPAARHKPVVVDFSCSVVASGRLILARKKGEKIPLGWAVDKAGRPTEDPYEGYEGGGSLAPVGGHKGYGLALANEIMSALLGGGKWTINKKASTKKTTPAFRGPVTRSWPWTRTPLSAGPSSRRR